MRVVSSLADIDFGVGRIGRSGRNLVIESSADSTIATKVTVTPRDALRSLGALLRSPSAWWFVLLLPVAVLGGPNRKTGDAWVQRRAGVGLNKPW
ncbi:hypothetical protein [Sphingomonas sp. ERG5]|uniref:hypothetical protein n=1 Tax=Sphingomonas sp. ERG5 TaxID=1381597 RepID=UPI00054BE744|nr:hypothetical protein [Sphingomonas sp. ERG5]